MEQARLSTHLDNWLKKNGWWLFAFAVAYGVLPRSCYESRTPLRSDILTRMRLIARRYAGDLQEGKSQTRNELETPGNEQWMRIGITVLALVSVICTLLIVVVRLR